MKKESNFSILLEKLSQEDKSEIKKLIKSELKDILRDEIQKELRTSESKEEIVQISKKVLKKLYKALALQHPYVIDRLDVWRSQHA